MICQYDTLTTAKTFDTFGSTRSNGMSLESIHNNIHVSAACGNQFQDTRLSGFDPLL